MHMVPQCRPTSLCQPQVSSAKTDREVKGSKFKVRVSVIVAVLKWLFLLKNCMQSFYICSFSCSLAELTKHLSLVKVKSKMSKLCTSWWMKRTSQFPGNCLLNSQTTWRNMWCNTNKQDVPQASHLIGSKWTKAERQQYLQVCLPPLEKYYDSRTEVLEKITWAAKLSKHF